jgi:hypothetical protein
LRPKGAQNSRLNGVIFGSENLLKHLLGSCEIENSIFGKDDGIFWNDGVEISSIDSILNSLNRTLWKAQFCAWND